MVYNSQLTILLNTTLPHQINILGYVLGMEAIGAIIAGIVLSRYKNISNYVTCFLVGFFLISIGTCGLSLYKTTWPLVLLFIAPMIRGIGSSIAGIPCSYLIRKESPEQYIGCISGINLTIQNVALAFGTLLSGVLVLTFGVKEVYIGLSLIMLLLALSMTPFIKKYKLRGN
jgi:MFS family permease